MWILPEQADGHRIRPHYHLNQCPNPLRTLDSHYIQGSDFDDIFKEKTSADRQIQTFYTHNHDLTVDINMTCFVYASLVTGFGVYKSRS
eukprot:g22035.t1